LVKQAADNGGRSNIDFADGSRWRSARYRTGDIGLTPPGCGVSLRWANRTPYVTVHLLIPEAIMREAAEDLEVQFEPRQFKHHVYHDSLLRHAIMSVERAAEQGAGESYAEAAAVFLAGHLFSGQAQAGPTSRDGRYLSRIDDYLASNLSSDLVLGDLSSALGISRFRLTRLCKDHWSETPFKRLTEKRMQHGRKLLHESSLGTMEIAMECGYGNPLHFAVAFRRSTGMSPRDYRSR
jgi:AraC family transcriptional regulator